MKRSALPLVLGVLSDVLEAERAAVLGKVAGPVVRTVVGHDATNRDEAAVISDPP